MYGEVKSWLPKEIELLLVLAEQGLSFSQIAQTINDRLGASKTRNSVVGKMHRMGLMKPLAPRPPKIPKPLFRWTAEMDAHVRYCFEAGNLRPSQIAIRLNNKFGTEVSHIMVGKRMSVLGLRDYVRVPERRSAGYVQEPQHIELPFDRNAPTVSFIESTRFQCKWPAKGEGRAMRVCGQAVTCGSYCSKHASLAYRLTPGHAARQVR